MEEPVLIRIYVERQREHTKMRVPDDLRLRFEDITHPENEWPDVFEFRKLRAKAKADESPEHMEAFTVFTSSHPDIVDRDR